MHDTPLGLVALLFIKGESVRVPDKNFRTLGGRPLFRWIVDTVLRLECVDCLLINTDARARLIEAGLPNDRRIRIQDRAPELCGHEITANELLPSMMAAVPASRYLQLHTTSPFLQAETMERAVAEFDRAVAAETADSLMGVTRYQSRFYTATGEALNHDPNRLIPTQNLAPVYEENSSIYLFSLESFSSTGTRVGRNPVLFECAASESLDIDTEEDWQRAVDCLAVKDVL